MYKALVFKLKKNGEPLMARFLPLEPGMRDENMVITTLDEYMLEDHGRLPEAIVFCKTPYCVARGREHSVYVTPKALSEFCDNSPSVFEWDSKDWEEYWLALLFDMRMGWIVFTPEQFKKVQRISAAKDMTTLPVRRYKTPEKELNNGKEKTRRYLRTGVHPGPKH